MTTLPAPAQSRAQFAPATPPKQLPSRASIHHKNRKRNLESTPNISTEALSTDLFREQGGQAPERVLDNVAWVRTLNQPTNACTSSVAPKALWLPRISDAVPTTSGEPAQPVHNVASNRRIKSNRRRSATVTGLIATVVAAGSAVSGLVPLPDAIASATSDLPNPLVPLIQPQVQVGEAIDEYDAADDSFLATRVNAASRAGARTELVADEFDEDLLGAEAIDNPEAYAAAELVQTAETVVDHEALGTAESSEQIATARQRVVDLLVYFEANPEADQAPLEAAYEQLNALLDELASEALTVQAKPAPMTAADVLAEQIALARADAPRLRAYQGSLAGFPNGRIPINAMQSLSWAPNHHARRDAAAQFERLNEAFRAHFGTNISITDSYRSFEGQVRVRARVPHLAAVPGHSNHGWGIAVDLGGGIQRFGTPEHQWMRQHAPDFGWILPGWAQERGSRPEPWHWEFHPDQQRMG